MKRLFDDTARDLRRQRALKGAHDWFLHRYCADEVHERLNEVNRTFKDVTIVGWRFEEWQAFWPDARLIADEEVLDIAPNSCDLIIHALSLHAANDPVGALVQMRRALRPDGLMIAVLFGGKSLQELRYALTVAESEIEGGLSPRIHPMGEIRDMGGLLQRAGFALPVADSAVLNLSYPSPHAVMKELQNMGESNSLTDRKRIFLKRAVLEKTEEIYRTQHAEGDRVSATAELVFLTGWAPSETQQKPLRPGSAQARLADALGVPEQSS